MPEKSIREMSARERARHSLASKAFRATMLGTVVLGLVTLLATQGLYFYVLFSQHIGEAFSLSRSAATVLGEVVDTEPLAREVMDTYRALSDEERVQTGTQDYRGRFARVTGSADYREIYTILGALLSSSEADDLYLAVLDGQTSAIVYVCDPDERETLTFAPGEWEPLGGLELEKFLNWDGNGRLYDISYTKNYGWLCTAGVPAGESAEGAQCFLLADISLDNILHRMRAFALEYLLALLVIMFLFAWLQTRHMRKTIIQPINAIADAARDYVRDRRAGAAAAEHFSSLDIRTGDEVENLGMVMADMERDLSEYMEDLSRAVAERERIGTELSLATRIQAAMLPDASAPFPEHSDFRICASMTPAKEVGGDFYDFFLLDDRRLALVIADVSGKGIPAALFMMASKILLQEHVKSGCGPARALAKINEQICLSNREEMFITVWLGILDLDTGVLTACNAGHEYPILRQPNGDFELVKDKHGFVIGGMADVPYTEYELKLEPGARLFVYSDGVPEATDAHGELFGMERTLRTLNRVGDRDPQTILVQVHEAVDLFVGEAPRFDDMTMLCVEYVGQRTEEASSMNELTLEAKIENIPTVTDFIDAKLEALDCPMKTQMQIDMAVDEVFSNIANYAYAPSSGEATVRFSCEEAPRAAVITFLDRGVPYNPLENRDPDVTLPVEERQIGGLGIFLVKKTMDVVSYEFLDGKNILRIKKYF